MTSGMMWTGFLGTLLILAALGTAILREPGRQTDAIRAMRVEAVTTGTDLYAENCAVCHGAAGEGIGATPPLATEGVRSLKHEDLFRVIERGRYNTNMAAYGVEEGGIFTNAQIDSLVAVIHYANWNTVAVRVEALGLTPPEPVMVELADAALDSVRALPDGDALADGLAVYVTECASCHGAEGEGVPSLGTALNTPDIRTQASPGGDVQRVIEQGVPGTLMAGWERTLTPAEIDHLLLLIRRWDEIGDIGLELPAVPAVAIDMSPAAIAEGQRLYGILCAQCHGVEGYGTRLAPALNSQTFLSETPDTAILQIIKQGVPGTTMPAWGGRLTENDLAALTAYMRSWEPTAPTITVPADSVNPPTGGGGPPWRQN
jgi:mono/diheme cytochrome c family protein